MVVCDKCWSDAHIRSQNNTTKSQYEHYLDILKEVNERNKLHTSCSCGGLRK
jgi:hypothetical protein